MNLEHVAIWTNDLERLKTFYAGYFGAISGAKYVNETRRFESYFLQFESGARLEIMSMPGVPENLNDTVSSQHQGIIHLAFGASSKKEVDEKAKIMSEHGCQILSGPRVTGDGYYEFETVDPDNNRIEVTYKLSNGG